MSRVFGLHEIELRPEVDAAEYERIFAEEFAPSAAPTGLRVRLLKGERGVRAGHYLLLMELDDVETRDRYFPAPGQESSELLQFMEQHPDTAAAWGKLDSSAIELDTVTDYLVLVE